MWKFLFAFFLLCFSAMAQGQDILNTLGRYSYQVQLNKQCVTPQAMGFFVRYEQRLFFITTARCVTGWDPVKTKLDEDFPDTIFIKIAADTSKAAYLPLPISEIKKTAKRFKEIESPDVYVLEIKNPKRYNVFSIEDFFEEEVPCELAKQVVVAGQTVNGNMKDAAGNTDNAYRLNASLTSAYCNYPYLPDAKVYDQLHYFASFKENMTDQFLAGSPAYLVTEDEAIVFGGIYIGSTRGGAMTGRIVRPEYVMNKIKKRILDK